MQGSKLKKSSGCPVANNCRNIVVRCKFLVSCFYNVNDAAQGLWYFARSWSHEIHKSMQNTAKFGRNLMRYMSVQHIWNLSQQIYLETSSLKHANNVPKLPGVDYVVKNWALAMMLKALPLVHFWSILLLKEQMMTSVWKTLKMLVWSADRFLVNFP